MVFCTLLGATLGAFALTGATDDETPIGPKW
jgi:hypothetical protein